MSYEVSGAERTMHDADENVLVTDATVAGSSTSSDATTS